jgi:lysylphosphatidylglycerol synthetase-like protein (DUF2156 family)
MFEISVVIAVVVALTQLIKKMNLIPIKFLPIVTIVLGLLAGIFYVEASTIQEKIMMGVMIGLSSSGLFDQSKIITKRGR